MKVPLLVPAPPPALPGKTPNFDEVYTTHARSVSRWIQRLGGPRVDAEDVLQEVFLTVHRELPHFRGASKLPAWLFQITYNAVRHRRRKEWLRRWLKGGTQELERHGSLTMLTPVDELEQRQSRAQLYELLDRLPEKYRTVLVLFELEDVGAEELADLMGIAVSTVWVRVHRGRKLLHKALVAEQSSGSAP
ncbi:MAG: RNA polymerase sigma factor [Myxococcaceae bacterium]